MENSGIPLAALQLVNDLELHKHPVTWCYQSSKEQFYMELLWNKSTKTDLNQDSITKNKLNFNVHNNVCYGIQGDSTASLIDPYKRPQPTDARPLITDFKPQTTDDKPKITDIRPHITDIIPHKPEARPKITDVRPQTTDRPQKTVLNQHIDHFNLALVKTEKKIGILSEARTLTNESDQNLPVQEDKTEEPRPFKKVRTNEAVTVNDRTKTSNEAIDYTYSKAKSSYESWVKVGFENNTDKQLSNARSLLPGNSDCRENRQNVVKANTNTVNPSLFYGYNLPYLKNIEYRKHAYIQQLDHFNKSPYDVNTREYLVIQADDRYTHTNFILASSLTTNHVQIIHSFDDPWLYRRLTTRLTGVTCTNISKHRDRIEHMKKCLVRFLIRAYTYSS